MAVFSYRSVGNWQRFKDRIEEFLKGFVAAQPGRESDIAGEHRADSKDDQRHGHGMRRFMNMFGGMVIDPRLAKKRHEQETEHVKRRHSRHERPEEPQQHMPLLA